ncbi:unnamed protein product [Fraxinus pennsylvanica]|uniref:Uncharacterized protein n=1 Tax=Fraxinus pennsylvanica TaxID=56036 RepID=A0AAD1YKW1_9LAMI|nr:unnamed protein product [Fraxinus pennsylvanica]
MLHAPALHSVAMSTIVLLQKAAPMGAVALNASLLRGLRIVSSSSPSSGLREWSMQQLAGGCTHSNASDLLGSRMATSGDPSGGISTLMMSTNNGIDIFAAKEAFGGGEFGGKDME